MGMAASQARLLSITARMSNNENTGQAVSYAKQRLADQTQQITNEYNEALNATKLTVLTGFNGSVANYEDISYNRMTGLQMATSAKQYVVTDTKGRVLVTEAIADAYIKSKGNYNVFLAQFGLSQSDITVQKTYADISARTEEQERTEQQIHEAWDKYFASVGINKFMPEHDFGFSFTETIAQGTKGNSIDDYSIGDGYVGFIRALTDKDGNIVYKQAVDEDGQYVYSEYEYYTKKENVTQEVITGYKQARDENNRPVYGVLSRTFGNSSVKEVAYTVATDASGNPIFTTGENIEKRPYYVFNGYDSAGKPKYNVYKADSDKNDYTNGEDTTHYNVISIPDNDERLKYIPQFTNRPVYDLTKPVEDHSQPIIAEQTVTVYKGSKRYDTTSDPVYDYSQPTFVDTNGNYFYYDFDTDGDHINDSFTVKTQNKIVYDPINYEGTTQESRDLYDYAMAITEAYLRVGTGENGVEFKKTYNLDDYKSAANLENKNELKYYRNIFDKMQTSGFFTYTHTAAKATKGNDKDHYIYDETTKGTNKVVKNPLKDNYSFEAALRDGSLRLQYYSSTEKNFISTTISEDNCIQEVADERAIAKAESEYNQDMADLENKDKKFDLELKKLDTEHKALETEYESVKQVVNKNVETSFKIFS